MIFGKLFSDRCTQGARYIQGRYIQVRLYKPLSLFANFPAHPLSKVFFAFSDFALADENGQHLFFFFEDTRALIIARKLRVNSACSVFMSRAP